MSNEKETQVFDQSDLDNLMAEIQTAEADANTAESARTADDSSPEASDSTEAAVLEDTEDSEDSEKEKDDSGAEVAEGQALEQKDLDGLIEELNQDADDQPEASVPDSAKSEADEVATEAPSNDEGSAEDAAAPDSVLPSNQDDAGTETIDQSELEALIKELQEGVEAPEIEPPQGSEDTSAGTDSIPDAPEEAQVTTKDAEPQDPPDQPTPDAPMERSPNDTESSQSTDGAPDQQKPGAPSPLSEGQSEPQADATPVSSQEQTISADRSPRETHADQTPEETPTEPEQHVIEQIDDVQPAPSLQTSIKNSKRKILAGLAVAAVLIAVSGSSLFIKFRKPSPSDLVSEPPGSSTSVPIAASEPSQDPPVVAKEKSFLEPIDRVARINDKLEEARVLREELLTKHEEVLALKQHYQNGISLIRNEIQEEQTKNGIKSFPRAIKNNRIELGLQTIQRRMAYMDQLNQPLQWLRNASEELIFINRLITIDMRMLDTVSGIDLKALEQQIDEAIETYQPSVGRLAISYSGVELPPLKSIWDKMFQTTRPRIVPTRQTASVANGRNQAIWNELCEGNYQRRSDLTTLSPDAARCLANAKESDLFLNSIASLSPEAAKNLFAWEGNWVCLNGLSQISSETARYLFNWNGNWISLNGLHDLRAEAARHLVHWQGRQLELMGLQFKGQPQELHMLTYLAQWKQAGGKLYVPDKIEKQIAKLMD